MRRQSYTTWGWACLATTGLSLSMGGCGQNTGLTIKILTPPDSDPFAGSASVVLSLQGDQMSQQQTTSTVMSGRFEAKLELTSPSHDSYVYVKVEALDAAGQTVGRGRSPLFVLPKSDLEVPIYVGRPGQVTATTVRLPDDSGNQGQPVGRKFLSGASLRGKRATPSNETSIGVMVVGGLNESAQPMAHSWTYNPMLHNLVDSGVAQAARHGAVLVPSADGVTGHQALLWGGADASGNLLTTVDKFDAAASDPKLLWQNPDPGMADAGAPGAYLPTVVEVKDSEFLVTGGNNQVAAGGQPLMQAVLLSRTAGATSDMPAKLSVARIPPTGSKGPMLAPRFSHSATPVSLTVEGIGALLYGGLSNADIAAGAPVAELFLESTKQFAAFGFADPQPESRRGHVAVTLKSGKVLIAGGYTEDGAGKKTVLDSAYLIDPGTKSATVKAGFLRTPRYAATITMLASEILICGGFDGSGSDGSGVPQKTCEEFSNDDTLSRLGELYTMPRARAGHLALPLETDQVLLVGGVGDGMLPLSEFDIYTAR